MLDAFRYRRFAISRNVANPVHQIVLALTIVPKELSIRVGLNVPSAVQFRVENHAANVSWLVWNCGYDNSKRFVRNECGGRDVDSGVGRQVEIGRAHV